MPKTFIAKNIVSISSINFQVEAGVVKGLSCNVEVNYGEMGLAHQFQLWDLFTDAQKQTAQKLYDGLLAKVNKLVLE